MTAETNSQPDSDSLQGQYAGFVSRFLAFLIDVVVVIIIVTLFGFTVDVITRFFGLDQLIDSLVNLDNVLGDLASVLALLGSVAFISFAYFVTIWTVTAGQSVGKLLLGLRIVPMNGSRMGFVRSIVRYYAFIFAALALFVGLLWVLVSDSRQGWHDKIARTCVIYNWPAREDEGVVRRLHSRWHHVKQRRKNFEQRLSQKRSKTQDGEGALTAGETD